MKTARVQSTTLSTVAYDANREILELRFRSRAVYRYFEVPVEVHAGLLRAASKGTYFNDVIRDCYPFVRLRGGRS